MAEWRLGNYLLKRKLGEGGMAQVYLARDVRLERDVAVKVLDRKLAERPGFRDRFMREARVAAALDHPNIVPLYDFGDENALFLVMPFLSGGSLQDLLPRTPLQPSEVVTYGSQIADALDYAHQRKVVHRDVKPANMLIHADGRLLLADFGLAKIVHQTNTPNLPRNRPDAGTPEYMAPEQVIGSSDARSDIYGLGVVLYLLLTGRLPFTGSSSREVMHEHLRSDPTPPRRYNPNIPPAMETVVLRAMAKAPEDRYQRASELGAALLGALIASHSSDVDPFSRPPSFSSSPPTGPAVIVPRISLARHSDRPGDAAPPWAPRSSAANAHISPSFGLEGHTPRAGSWDDGRQSSSITGMLPDLNVPFASFEEAPHSGAPAPHFPSNGGARSGNWGSFAGSQAAGSGPGVDGSFANSHITGRMPVSPAPRAPGFSAPTAGPQMRATMAPVTSRPRPEEMTMMDSRAALPGSRMTDPPDEPPVQLRSSRLWIAIALLLIIMLVALVALWRFLQMSQGIPLQ